MKKKTIELTVEQARELLGKDEAMDVLIRANFTEDELKLRVKRWEDLETVSGWFVNNNSDVEHYFDAPAIKRNRNIFATKEQAEGVLAMAQLSQLMKRVNGDWKPDWNDVNTKNHTIYCDRQSIKIGVWHWTPQFLAFPTPEIRDQFAKDHEALILEFFKIYQ